MKLTPPKINIEPENDGLVQMIFLFQGGVFSGSMLIFWGVIEVSGGLNWR